MIKVAIMYICTGSYDIFWKDFFDSYERNFLPNSLKEYYVFSDTKKLYAEDTCDRIHRIYQKKMGWPDDTLMRFHMFDSISNCLMAYDYIFFMNANCICVKTVKEEEFLPKKKDILVVQHPGFYNKKPDKFAYDRNSKSTAYIPKGQGKYYICGGVNGGKAEAFIDLIRELKYNVDVDKKNGVISKWHDESHINHYIIEHDNWKMLSPSFCFPEGWKIPFEPKIIVRDKNKYFDTISMKYGKIQSIIKKSKILKVMNDIYEKLNGR